MPKINVYLSDELSEAVRDAGIPVSAICQRALEQAVSRITAIRESMVGDGAVLRSDLDAPSGQFSRFTDRARTVVALAMNDAAQTGVPTSTEHLLAGMLAEGAGLALSVLLSMEIEPQEVAAVLASRRSAVAATVDAASFDATAQEALRLTMTESASLGHNYVGTEHLLLGLVAEPDGLAGQVLRGLGAELRLTRRAVAGAIAGYASLQANSAAKTLVGSPAVAAMLSSVIRTELAPIVDRLDRLESR